MYRTVGTLADSLADEESARLASAHLKIEENFSQRLWPYLGLLEKMASRPPRVRALLSGG